MVVIYRGNYSEESEPDQINEFSLGQNPIGILVGRTFGSFGSFGKFCRIIATYLGGPLIGSLFDLLDGVDWIDQIISWVSGWVSEWFY